MGWKQWSAVAVVIGGGILLQIPGHDEVGMDHGEMPVMAEPQGPYTTVALDVTGLTWEGCASAARVAVENVEGVSEAIFSFERAEGFVTFDTTMTSVAEIVAELERMTAFRAIERPDAGGWGVKVPRIELVYFEGCPNTAEARDNLRVAVEASGRPLEWSEWDLMAESTPADFRRYGSPTVLIDGQDVTGADASAVAVACRADGAPSVASIAEKLR